MGRLPAIHAPLFLHQWGYAVLIGCVCPIGYRGLIDQPWTYDDGEHLQAAKVAQHNPGSIFYANTREPTRVVLHLYFYWAYKVFGENPAGYHGVSIVVHILNSLLCARIFFALFRNSTLAYLSGFLFALNSTFYEAVYKVSAFGLLLGSTFSLLAVLST
jgi:hypothetical protein